MDNTNFLRENRQPPTNKLFGIIKIPNLTKDKNYQRQNNFFTNAVIIPKLGGQCQPKIHILCFLYIFIYIFRFARRKYIKEHKYLLLRNI